MDYKGAREINQNETFRAWPCLTLHICEGQNNICNKIVFEVVVLSKINKYKDGVERRT